MDHTSNSGMAGMSGMSGMSTGTGTSSGGMTNMTGTSSGGMSNSTSGGMSNMSSSGGMGNMAGMPGMSGHSGGSPMMSTSFVASIPTVPLWFSGWQPTTAGGMFGACVGLCALAVLARLLGAVRHQASVAWAGARWAPHAAHVGGSHATLDKADESAQVRTTRHVGRWNVAQDVPRGMLGALHTGIEYFLMLAVMTFNAYFFIAIIIGVFIGETWFGRWGGGGGGGHG